MIEKSLITRPKSKYNFIILTITIFTGFLIFGFSENIKGPAIPRMQAEFNLSEFQIGLLLATNSVGYLTACLYTAALARKIGLKLSLILCFTSMALAGIAICFSPTYITLLISYFTMYLGNGMLEITLGLMAATIFTKNTGTMMNLSHFFYGLSSSFAPLLSVAIMKTKFNSQVLGWRYMYLIVLSSCIIPIIPAIFGQLRRKLDYTKSKGYKAFLKDKSSFYIIIILSLGVTCEMSVGGWLANFMEKSYSLNENSAALVLTAFFICFTLSRLLIGPLTDKIGFIKSLIIFTGFSGLSIIIGVLSGKIGIMLLVSAGFGIAPIYPTIMAVMAKLFTDNIDNAMTVTLTLMGITIASSNLLLGGLIDLFRNIFTKLIGETGTGLAYAAGYLFIGLCSIIASLISIVLYKNLKKDNKLV